MGDIYDETVGLIESLGELTPHGKALAATARALAMDADNPFVDEDGKQASRSANANSLRATLNELVQKGRHASSDEDKADTDGWASAAAGAGATPIRNTA